jgi:hypothetical protein
LKPILSAGFSKIKISAACEGFPDVVKKHWGNMISWGGLMKGGFRLYLIMVFIAVLSGCTSSKCNDDDVQFSAGTESDEKRLMTVTVNIPEFPFNENKVVTIDKDIIGTFAQQFAIEEGEGKTDAEFFLGYLPLKTADMLCSGNVNHYEINRLLGNLYVSGYFGGIWLRDALGGNAMNSRSFLNDSLPSDFKDAAGSGDNTLVFNILMAMAGSKVKRAGSNDFTALAACRLSMPSFLLIYGYNWGYFDYILKNPPEGAGGIEQPCNCSRMLDCNVPGLTLETLDKYKSSRDLLEDPENAKGISVLKWYEMKALTGIWANGAVNTGSGVWENIMNENMDKDTYMLLLDLSARFMLVAEMSILPAMKGYAEGDTDACRCGLLQQAAMIVWAGSYFMGLGSDAPAGTFPSINRL